jgi:hypothetical protein
VVDAATLFRRYRQVVTSHNGYRYVLRITQLILNKYGSYVSTLPLVARGGSRARPPQDRGAGKTRLARPCYDQIGKRVLV